MTTTFKKALSWLLSILLVAFLVPFTTPDQSFAEGNETSEETVPDELAEKQLHESTDSDADGSEEDVKSVEAATKTDSADESVTENGMFGFGAYSWSLEDGVLTLTTNSLETLTGKETIGYKQYADSIHTVKLNGQIAVNKCRLFNGLTNLKHIENLWNIQFESLPYEAKEGLGSSIHYEYGPFADEMFKGCASLQTVDFTWLDTSKVLTFDSMFEGCTALETVDLSCLDTSRLLGMTNSFKDCRSLTRVVFPNTTIKLASYYISRKDVDNNHWYYKSDGSKGMFSGCSSIEKIDLSSIRATDNIEETFYNCSSLKEIQLFDLKPYAFSDLSLTNLFKGCTSLLSLDLSTFDTSKLDESSIDRHVGRVFDDALLQVTIGENFTMQKCLPSGVWYNTAGDKFIPTNIPSGVADTYTKASAATSVSIHPISESFISVGSEYQLEADVEPQPSSNTIRWISSDESIGTVDASTGTFTAIAPGIVTITATAGSVSDTITIEVRKCVRSVTMKESSKVVYVNAGPFTLQADVDPPDAYNAALGWQSSNTAVAIVDASGQVTPLAVGETTITATAGGFSDTCTVVVEDEPIISVTSVSVDPATLTLTGQESKRVSATVLPADATNKDVEWSSSNSSVAAVDADGNVSAQSKGTATITASTLDGGKEATCTVTVLNPPTTATLGATPHEVRVSKSENVTVTLAGALSGATEALDSAVWETSDASVLSVSGSGLTATVTGVAAGNATITFRGTYGSSNLTAAFDVDVIWDDVSSITLSETEKVLMMGSSPYELHYTIQPMSAQGATVLWKSSNSGIASVDANGRVTPVSVGEATITVTAKGASAQCKITVIEKPEDVVDVTALTLDRTQLELTGNQSERLVATVVPANATYKTVHWSSSDPSIAKVDTSGVVTSVRKGSVTITASSFDGAKKATCAVTVLNPLTSITLAPSAKTVTVGESFNVGVTPKGALPGDVDSVGNIAWSSSDEAVVRLTPNAMVANVDAVGTGVGVITATAQGTSGDVSATSTIHVAWPTPEVMSLDRHEARMDVTSEPLQLNVSATPADSLHAGLRWVSTDSKVVSVDETGLVRPVGAGNAVISVTLGALKDECTITVDPMRLDSSSDSEVPGYVTVRDPATAALLKGLHVVINKSNVKNDSRLAALVQGNNEEEMAVAEAYDIYLADDAGNRVAWNSPNDPLTVYMQMDDAMKDLALKNSLRIHYVDDGFTTLETKTSQQRDGYFVFETTHFSTYALTATPLPDGNPVPNGTDVGNGPSGGTGSVGGGLAQTGDEVSMLLALYGGLWAMAGCILIFARRKQQTDARY